MEGDPCGSCSLKEGVEVVHMVHWPSLGVLVEEEVAEFIPLLYPSLQLWLGVCM